MPSGNLSEYIYGHKKLVIKRNGKLVDKIKLTDKDKKSIDSTIQSICVSKLENEYEGGGIDGLGWTFSFEINGKKKEVYLHNYYHDTLDILVRNINHIIPQNNQFISFGKDMHLIQDTLVQYLPDFYINSFELPDTNYESSLVWCLGKDNGYTTDLDSIELCICNIYPKDYSKTTRRVYWRAYRHRNGEWKREYFDSNDLVVKTDLVFEIVPYEIIDEKIVVDSRTKPRTKITRYYKTRTEQK